MGIGALVVENICCSSGRVGGGSEEQIAAAGAAGEDLAPIPSGLAQASRDLLWTSPGLAQPHYERVGFEVGALEG